MTRRRRAVAAAVVVLVIGAIRLAITSTFATGYLVIDNYNVAVQVIGAHPTWRAVTVQTETATQVTIGIDEIALAIGPGSGDERIAYVVATLHDPLAGRRVVNAATGLELPRLAP